MERNPEYLSLQELWNDRRDPHANPLSKAPRREKPRMTGKSVSQYLGDVYRPGPPTN